MKKKRSMKITFPLSTFNAAYKKCDKGINPLA
jgi:hypothetical protein